jgi:hypothetical protein
MHPWSNPPIAVNSGSDSDFDSMMRQLASQAVQTEEGKCKELNRYTAQELLNFLYASSNVNDVREKFSISALYGSADQTFLHCIANDINTENRDKLLKLAQEAINAGVSIDAKDVHNCTALYHAVSNYPFIKDPKLIEWLLEKGANPNIQCAEGNTALHRAATFSTSAVSDLLLSFSADPKINNDAGLMPRQSLINTKHLNINHLREYDKIVEKWGSALTCDSISTRL